MHFHVVTPCLLADDRLQRTVRSVVAQSALEDGKHSLSYRVHMPESSPETSIVTSMSKNIDVRVVRAADDGLYDALVAGFSACESADVYCYLGAGDYFSPDAFQIASEVMSQGADWITGLICGYNDRGHLIEAAVPFRYRPRLIRAGLYGRRLPFIQQESTFWSGRVHKHVDWTRVRSMKLAGDALIWHCLAEVAELTIVEAWLGGFETRQGQLSRRYANEYRDEVEDFARAPGAMDHALALMDWLLWRAPRRVKRMFDQTRFVYRETDRTYRRLG